jgi:hypothetical protein
VNTSTSYGDLGISGKDKEAMSNQEVAMSNQEVTISHLGWMLVWACVAVFGACCVAAVVLN